jgi:hypothetical protein
MRKAGEFNYFNDNLYNFLNKFLKSDFIFPFGYPFADKRRWICDFG